MRAALIIISLLKIILIVITGHPNSIAWSGGPLHLECEHPADMLTGSTEYSRDNVIAIKAVSFKDDIYIITPRYKRGVLSSIWQLIRGRHGVELQAYPDVRSHAIGDCQGVQNAVDIYLDHLGNLWVLDTGLITVLENPQCTCEPKVVVISTIKKKITKNIDISSVVEATSILQNIVIEYVLGAKPFIYVSDASRGSILVYDVSSSSEWVLLVSSPTAALQLGLTKRKSIQTVLILVDIHQKGLFELDTAALRRKKTSASIKVFGDNGKQVLLLGTDKHHVYFRHAACADVLSWNTRSTYNESSLINIHSPGPSLLPTSVTTDPIKHVVLILDSNYGDTVRSNLPTYHRITFVG